MHLNALLDVDVVAVEADDLVNVMIELKADEGDPARERQPGALQIVLDRSASMAGERLDAAKRALHSIVGALDPQDAFGIVTFDDGVEVVVPAAPLADKHAVRQAIAAIEPGGMTNLSSGLMRGLEEARRAGGDGGATIILLSDGQANAGVTDPGQLERLTAGARRHHVTCSTIGVGLGYDEVLLQALSRGGAGTTHFAEDGDQAGTAIAAEVHGLLEQVAQAASLTVLPTGDVSAVSLYNDLSTAGVPGGFVAELGDFHAGEERKLVLGIEVPGKSALGLAKVCEFELRWTDARTLDSHTVTLPIRVNVLPGDEAAGRIPDPVVRTEVAFQAAQEAKRRAGDALREGRIGDAAGLFEDAGAELYSAALDAPADRRAELKLETDVLRDLATGARVDAAHTAKVNEADRARKSRRRGHD